jgi:hypothetical protein
MSFDVEHLKLALKYNASHSEEHAKRIGDKFFEGKAFAFHTALLLIDLLERDVVTEQNKRIFKKRMKKEGIE